MKKTILSILTLSIVFTIVSCNYNDMEPDESQYLRVYYHSNGHTSGEPPVDPNLYRPGNYNVLPPTSGDTYTILDQGTLEREDHTFAGWLYQGDIDRPNKFNFLFKPGDRYAVNIEDDSYYAVWRNPNGHLLYD